MVEEEKQHAAAVKGKDMSKLSKEENIAELIYQLRTQRGFQVCCCIDLIEFNLFSSGGNQGHVIFGQILGVRKVL